MIRRDFHYFSGIEFGHSWRRGFAISILNWVGSEYCDIEVGLHNNIAAYRVLDTAMA